MSYGKTWAPPFWKTPRAFPAFPQFRRLLARWFVTPFMDRMKGKSHSLPSTARTFKNPGERPEQQFHQLAGSRRKSREALRVLRHISKPGAGVRNNLPRPLLLAIVIVPLTHRTCPLAGIAARGVDFLKWRFRISGQPGSEAMLLDLVKQAAVADV